MVAIKRKLYEIADVNSSKITEDPALDDLIYNTVNNVNNGEWEDEGLFNETKASNSSSVNLSDIKSEGIALPVKTIVKEENVSDDNDETYEPNDDHGENDDDFKPPKEKKAKSTHKQLDDDGKPIKKRKTAKYNARTNQGHVNPEVCTHCGAWFHNAFRASQHKCLLKLTQEEGIAVPPTDSQNMAHEQICKFCHPFEPGKKKKQFHTCKLCDFSGMVTNLQRHFNKIHLASKTEECEKCGKQTTDMRSHIKNFHKQWNVFKCRYCDYRNFRQTNTQWHMKTKHPEMGHITCNEGQCRFLGYSEKQLERHKLYMHEKKEKIPDDLPKAERFFIKHGIPAFQNFQTDIPDLPKDTEILSCPYPPCHYESISRQGMTRHKADYHENFNLEKFMNETI